MTNTIDWSSLSVGVARALQLLKRPRHPQSSFGSEKRRKRPFRVVFRPQVETVLVVRCFIVVTVACRGACSDGARGKVRCDARGPRARIHAARVPDSYLVLVSTPFLLVQPLNTVKLVLKLNPSMQ